MATVKRPLDAPPAAAADGGVVEDGAPKKRKSRFSAAAGPGEGDAPAAAAPVGAAIAGAPSLVPLGRPVLPVGSMPGPGPLQGGLDPNVLRAVQEATARAAMLGPGGMGGVPGTATPAPLVPGGRLLPGMGPLPTPGLPTLPKVPLGTFVLGPNAGATMGAGVGSGAGMGAAAAAAAAVAAAAKAMSSAGLGGGAGGLLGAAAGGGTGASSSALSHISSQIAESLAKLRAVKEAVKAPAKASANPYLAHHRAAPAAAAPTADATGAPTPAVDDGTDAAAAAVVREVGVDPRLVEANRRSRGKRAFQFIAEGSIVKEAEHLRQKEAKNKIIAQTRGPGSRRKPTRHGELGGDEDAAAEDGDFNPNKLLMAGAAAVAVPARPPPDGPVPDVEWWDAAFLPADKRKNRAAAGVWVPFLAGVCVWMGGGWLSGWVGGWLCGFGRPLSTTLFPVRPPSRLHMCVHVCALSNSCCVGSPMPRAMCVCFPETLHAQRVGTTSRLTLEAELCATYAELAVANCKTTAYVEHPVPIQPLIDANAPRAMPLMLTKKERKRIRRQRRAEREKEKQDKIRLGLLPPPAPKVKISNLMRVLGERAVADPSMVEKEVREQMESRQRNHDMRNLARKLTPMERKDKAAKKNAKGMADGIHVALFRVRNLEDRVHRFKVEVNANESMLSGFVVLCKSANCNLVVVEGGTTLSDTGTKPSLPQLQFSCVFFLLASLVVGFWAPVYACACV
jgi:hypothetical protein